MPPYNQSIISTLERSAWKRHATLLSCLALLVLPNHLPQRMEAELSASPAPVLSVVRGTIGRGESLATALGEVLGPRQVHDLVNAARPVHDLARVRPGEAWGVALDEAGELVSFTYNLDELRVLRVSRRGGVLEPELHARSYDVEVGTAAGRIESSLFRAVMDAGEHDQLALDLAEIFAWDVDFNTELRPGDAFRVAVEKRYLDGELRGYGRILAAEFVRGDRTLRAVGYQAERGFGYYTPDGTPTRKAFLRSPLRFSRISSRFSRARLHPVLKTVRPHLGVDYAAPTGTPVQASADGVVVLAGWKGGLGKAVQIRHANGYQSLYGHLSRIEVRRGQRVSQGQAIGRVGSTGLATGPHLDYRMLKNGAFVNPLSIQSPPAEPLSPVELTAFLASAPQRLALLSAARVHLADRGGAPRDEG